jgi:uncharacterized protein YecE (DUF72 family)
LGLRTVARNVLSEGRAGQEAAEYASTQLTSIEINGTFYRSAKPEHFASWAAKTPDDFVFSVKATRYATNRKVLAEAGESIERFMQRPDRTRRQTRPHPLAAGEHQAVRSRRPGSLLQAAACQARQTQIAARAGRPPRQLPERRLLKLARKYKIATVITDSPKYPNLKSSPASSPTPV